MFGGLLCSELVIFLRFAGTCFFRLELTEIYAGNYFFAVSFPTFVTFLGVTTGFSDIFSLRQSGRKTNYFRLQQNISSQAVKADF